MNLERDIGLINQYSIKELIPEDVFAFSLILCDNEIDRDYEKFDKEGLERLAQLFIGKTGIFNHSRDAKDQVARIYKTEVEATGEKTALGEEKYVLRGYAYVLRNEFTKETIAKIEGGILKEISIGFAVKSCVCSICGEKIGWLGCANGHNKGGTYGGKPCYGLMKEPVDAYEFSFVTVPAQRGAGTTKNFDNGDIQKAFEILTNADLTGFGEELEELQKVFEQSKLSKEEREKRQNIIAENEKYLKEKKEK